MEVQEKNKTVKLFVYHFIRWKLLTNSMSYFSTLAHAVITNDFPTFSICCRNALSRCIGVAPLASHNHALYNVPPPPFNVTFDPIVRAMNILFV